ncbi:TPA: hypothetical protein R4X13_001811 [Enterobacter hormaechei subsp. steigerwaltii]|uniref:Uncharacterized protein n=1 Tax=Enterobacter cloacae subsp. cloacae (strain ATCC 13047 / DSM 30054 / NBRC 13535 / NCTC 10005 / WDCM 00083 / NCDC 279-56) TaxID=716541 RepID=A0A0H3CEN6_ENTCC|nr:hypothetical protein [Enterobacter kobei]ADF60069.1 hypothetical protein ECL_00503 [Enterobacter cloacae subsp. cloacae ATCC 13047]ELD7981797.1 hypothetical protein [Enterobacter hormaechei]MDU4295281.1 hypothetical protein [Enterobacter asburiae]HCD7313943.1 hypothetical protein [Enterobacter chengduensis]HED1379772.1 hypothetical protein [Enterobacter hormaechei subsp. steigerwaltii]
MEGTRQRSAARWPSGYSSTASWCHLSSASEGKRLRHCQNIDASSSDQREYYAPTISGD